MHWIAMLGSRQSKDINWIAMLGSPEGIET